MTRLTLGLLLLCSGMFFLLASPALATTTATIVGSVSSHDLSPWGMYQGADVVVKTVLIALLSASILTWAIWLFKMIQLKVASRHAHRLLTQLIDKKSFAQACSQLSLEQAPIILLVKAVQHELKLSSAAATSDEGLKERVVARIDRVQASLIGDINQGTGILASIGSVAPFVGLFGTVWGIMNSFIGIAQTQTTNLAVVAPGIAEALLATAVGLVAAIPAVIIYNYFSRSIAQYRVIIADIMTALMILLSRDLDRYHPDARLLPDLINVEPLTAVSLVKDAC